MDSRQQFSDDALWTVRHQCVVVACSGYDRPLLSAEDIPMYVGISSADSNQEPGYQEQGLQSYMQMDVVVQTGTGTYDHSIRSLCGSHRTTVARNRKPRRKKMYVKLLCTPAVNHWTVGTRDSPTQRQCLRK